jgi:hypothetical protein
MHNLSDGPGPDDKFSGDLQHRIGRLERLVDKHNRALRYLASFADMGMGGNNLE